MVGGFAAMVSAAYSALLLAELGLFHWIPCVLAAFVVGLASARIAYRRIPSDGRIETAGWFAAILIALGSLTLTLPSGEMLLGGWDPGVYLHTAAAIANHGSLQIPADDIAQLPSELRPDLVVEIAGWKHPFPGMFPLPNGRLSPQFMHLYPSLMAMAYSIGGVPAALLLNPLLNVVAVWLLFWLASKILGSPWGLAAALLLALNPAQVWQAKFGTAEILGQILLLAGAGLLIQSFRPPRHRLFTVLSGILFGLAFFTRYDAILFIAPLILLVIVLNLSRENHHSISDFLIPLAAIGLHAAWHMTRVAPCYRPLPGLVFPLLALVLSLGGAAWLLGTFFPRRPFARRILWIRWILIVGLLGVALFVMYIRPRLEVDGQIHQLAETLLGTIGQPQWLSRLAGPNAFNGDYLVAIFGPVGLLLAFAGVLVLIARTHERGIAVWLLASIAVMVLLSVNVFHDHFMMWVSRRFIPVVVPLLVIGIVAASQELYRVFSLRLRPLAILLSLAALAIPLLLVAPNTLAMASTRDWPGLANWLQQMANQIPPNSILFCDQPGFAAPLRFLHGIEAHEIHGGLTGEEFVLRHRDVLANRNAQALVLTMHQFSTNSNGVRTPIFQTSLSSHIQEQPRRSIPRGTKNRGGTFWLYSLHLQEKMDNPHLETAK